MTCRWASSAWLWGLSLCDPPADSTITCVCDRYMAIIILILPTSDDDDGVAVAVDVVVVIVVNYVV